ncbi:TfoX/Sxy family protein [Pararhizobium haloflavum]|uniref:TfoX/Sxy family protein n=1 Tax=Pararhizobium haloflavum TaxID=2037914 RepID=UPI000C18F88B|nr:TfoX/Sxy family protein [Pararhizobium haloflavum]
MDIIDIEDFFLPLGPVSIRRMFGGKGIYFEGRIIAIELGGELLLKADADSGPRFAAAGATQWQYQGKSKPVKMPYWSVPDCALDDPEARRVWLVEAHEAALRGATDGRRRP